jgi:hypothetical protein
VSSPTNRREVVAVAGSLAQKPTYGGHAWQFLQYLLGFRRLGYEVLFLDRLTPDMCADADGNPQPVRTSRHLHRLVEIMRGFGLEDSFSVLGEDGRVVAGRSRREALDHLRRSVLVLNVMGYLADDELLAAAPKRVFLDTDPGFGQMWSDLGLFDPFDGHDAFVTIAQNLGGEECPIPACGLEWIKLRPPVVLDEWPAQHGGLGAFTTIGAWRGRYEPIEYGGKTYGLRVHEFRKFADLPCRTGLAFEAALDIDPAEERDLGLLTNGGWRLIDPAPVTGDPWTYRRYLQQAGAELMVAKGIYVQTHSGWFSDRSVCFLASGKPVLAQDTAPGVPVGDGLVTFSTLDEAVAGAEAIAGAPERHARAARALAQEVFGSDRVLSKLLAELGVA